MKQNSIAIGNEYMTKVGDELVKVRVVQEYAPVDGKAHRTRFLVRRSDTGVLLPKKRTAAALRPIASKS